MSALTGNWGMRKVVIVQKLAVLCLVLIRPCISIISGSDTHLGWTGLLGLALLWRNYRLALDVNALLLRSGLLKICD